MLTKFFNNKYAYLLLGTCHFLIFAYDVEYDRDFWTWLWLFNAQINLLQYFRMAVKGDRKENLGNITNSTIIIK